MSLAVAYITSRKEPCIEWFFYSLARQVPHDCNLELIVIDSDAMRATRTIDVMEHYSTAFREHDSVRIKYYQPKPTIWSGLHRITRENWWSKSNSMNTAICLCESSHIAFLDDRSVVSPSWIFCIEESLNGGYAVCGSYEKRANMVVKDGVIVEMGELLGKDTRTQAEFVYDTRDWHGGSCALPLEWCLAVNGYSEKLCDGLGSEDSCFGITLRNSGYPMKYDPRMLIIEDRTPGQVDGGLKRADKGVSPNDKSHKIIEIIRDKTTSQNEYDIRNLRDRILNGEPFPPPVDSHYDWYDGQPISEMV